MKNIYDVVKNKKCTGCSACFNICPANAISMKKDREGFLSPKIDFEKCIHCGLCNGVCPSLYPPPRDEQFPLPKVYAAWNKNEKVRLESSSGGIFSALAEYFLEKKGYVCGAAFDENNKLNHIIVSNRRDFKKLRGSKYVQSEIGSTFKEIKELLEKDRWVLFSGTPCQAAGLRNYLKKDYEKLLVIDIVCHGVPSSLVFEKYLKEVEAEKKKGIKKISFRDKSVGWKNPRFVLKTEKGLDLINKELYEDTFGRGFLTNMLLGHPCTNCEYSEFRKVSDLTLGDFWGVWNYKLELDDNKGTSNVMINNEKGLFYINKIKKDLALFEEVPLEIAVNNNYPVLISSDKHVNREKFFQQFSERGKSIHDLIYEYLDDEGYGIERDEKCVGILNFYYENHNFGANLVAFSMQEIIEKIGYKAKIINYNPFPEPSVIDKYCSSKFYKFRQDFLKLTKLCRSESDLIKLNKQFNTFITGSDQVWRQLITGENALHYFLDFVFPSKNILSYGASFGHDYWDGDENTTRKAIELLKRFKAVSVRETDAVEILEKRFNLTGASVVLDPCLLLGEEDYEKLIEFKDEQKVPERYIAFYCLFDSEGRVEKSKKMNDIKSYTNCEVVNIAGKRELFLNSERFVYDSIPNFLNNIKNSSYVITDSYHGVLFSIIYKKDFICLGKSSKALSRFLSLFNLLDIDVEGRFLSSLEEVKKEIFTNKIDYRPIYKKLQKEKKKSLNYLRTNLKYNNSLESRISLLESELVEEKIQKKDLENTLLELRSHTQFLESGISDLEKQNSYLKQSIIELQQRESLLEQSIYAFEKSKSWKITKPFREIVHLFKLFKQQGVFRTCKNILLKIYNIISNNTN